MEDFVVVDERGQMNFILGIDIISVDGESQVE